MPRFVVLHHVLPADGPRRSHFDLMLEQDGGSLATWACETLPAAGCPTLAEKLGDHRLEYLEYEGPVSGDRGHVHRVDRGQYELIAAAPDAWQVHLAGETLRGRLSVSQDRQDPQRWSVEFEPD